MKKKWIVLSALLICAVILVTARGKLQNTTSTESKSLEEVYDSDEYSVTDNNSVADDTPAADEISIDDEELSISDENAPYSTGYMDLTDYFSSVDSVQTEKTVRVSTVDEFLNAIGSFTRVVLAPGDYNLDTATAEKYSNAYFCANGSDTSLNLVLKDLECCAIVGETGNCADVRISGNVIMTFEDGARCQLTGITLCNTEDKDEAFDTVLQLISITDFYLGNCEIYGSIFAYFSMFFTMENTLVRDDGYSSLTLWQTPRSYIKKCEFRNCGYTALSAESVDTLLMEDTLVHGFLGHEDYEGEESLFALDNCSNVKFIGCEICDNNVPRLICGDSYSDDTLYTEECSEPLYMENCSVHDNNFIGLIRDVGPSIKIYADNKEYLGGDLIAETHAGLVR